MLGNGSRALELHTAMGGVRGSVAATRRRDDGDADISAC